MEKGISATFKVMAKKRSDLKIRVSAENLQEAANVIDGIYSPITGFMKKEELESVLAEMRLPSGKIWSMPILLPITAEQAKQMTGKDKVVLADEEGREFFWLEDLTVYQYDLKKIAEKLFGTADLQHPGAAQVLRGEGWLAGGKLKAIEGKGYPRAETYISPQQTREFFGQAGWQTVVAFQTRNAPHRSHEYLQRVAMEAVDGLFINPVLGPKKSGDFRDEYILGSYQVLIQHYYPAKRVLLGTWHTFMRYAGPKEAVFHALVRKNFGCTHIIIGRDHAGVGNYYGTLAAQEIFDCWTPAELGIEVLKYNNAFYCQDCGGVVFEDQCQDDSHKRVMLSGTELRQRLSRGEKVPAEFMRAEVYKYLRQFGDKLFIQ